MSNIQTKLSDKQVDLILKLREFATTHSSNSDTPVQFLKLASRIIDKGYYTKLETGVLNFWRAKYIVFISHNE